MVLGEFFVIGDSPAVSVLIWGALFVTFLYL